MTYAIRTAHGYRARSRVSVTWRVAPGTAVGAATLAAAVMAGAWMLAARPFAAVDTAEAPAPVLRHMADTTPRATSAPRPLDPEMAAAIFAAPMGGGGPLASNLEAPAPGPLRPDPDPEVVPSAPAVSPLVADAATARNVPLPTPRPHDLDAPPAPGPVRVPDRRMAQANRAAPTPATPADTRSVFEKLFGLSPSPAAPGLAYATPEDGAVRRPQIIPSLPDDKATAIYDISAHTVYLPNGQALEAHSGLGDLLDDPNHVSARNRGATPPQLYDLKLRETLFHGVQALRLTPTGMGSVYGRAGLLAHSYMLGPNGQSNGCVSFRDYQAFLRAFQNGEVKRLAVVARRA